MDKPPYSSLEMYTIMRQCWQHHPAQRPAFGELVQDLERILTFTASDVSTAHSLPLTRGMGGNWLLTTDLPNIVAGSSWAADVTTCCCSSAGGERGEPAYRNLVFSS